MAIELKPILKTRQLKLRKPTIREPTVVSNPVRPRLPRRPRKSKQPPVDTWYQPFCSTRAVARTDFDKKSPQFRIAHVQHFESLKSDFPVLDKMIYHEINKACLGVSLRRFQQWFQQYKEPKDGVLKHYTYDPPADTFGINWTPSWSPLQLLPGTQPYLLVLHSPRNPACPCGLLSRLYEGL